nr:hypothetical protein [Acidobacteriota bacterium]
KPSLASLGRQALMALVAAIVISTVAYVVAYKTFFVRLPETFDMLRSSRPFFRVRFPERLLRWSFRSSFERGCSSFTIKALLRSEQHLMFLGAYLGIGLVMVAQSALDWTGDTSRALFPTSDYLSTALLIAFFVVSGLRFAFDMPAALEANWLFQISADSPRPAPREIARRLMLWIVVPPEILLLTPLTAANFGWRVAVMHSAITVALTVFAADALLSRFQKIPFTCHTQLDIKRLIVRMLGTVFGVLLVVPAIASVELWMLRKPVRLVGLAMVLAVGWRLLDRYRREAEDDGAILRFEDGPGEP